MNTNELRYTLKQAEREITQLRQRNAILEANAEEWETMRSLARQLDRNYGWNTPMGAEVDILHRISVLLDQIDHADRENSAECDSDVSTDAGTNAAQCCNKQ